MRRTGQTLAVGSLAREYGFTDVDGRQPTAYPIVWYRPQRRQVRALRASHHPSPLEVPRNRRFSQGTA